MKNLNPYILLIMAIMVIMIVLGGLSALNPRYVVKSSEINVNYPWD